MSVVHIAKSGEWAISNLLDGISVDKISSRLDSYSGNTKPLPAATYRSQRAMLERLGEQYHEHRRQIMLARQEGLIKTYNRFHDPAEHSANIAELWRLHVETDWAVLDAYGWSDVNLDHDFQGEGKEARYSLSDRVKEELLRWLLELNFEIAAKEQSAGGEEDIERWGGERSAVGVVSSSISHSQPQEVQPCGNMLARVSIQSVRTAGSVPYESYSCC